MNNDVEVRIKLAPSIHRKWQLAAVVRGLSLKGFIASTVSAELIRTGELKLASSSPVPLAPLSGDEELDWGGD